VSQHIRATDEMTLKPGPALAGKVWQVWKP
jgi:hypothetical protein